MHEDIKVLFVDDERGLLDQSKVFLEREDERLDIIPVSSAEKALELLDDEDFDVIVSDYQMPEIDGLEFLEIVREERKNEIPFLLFTGKGREEVAMKALNLGAERYLQKGGSPKSQFAVLADSIVQEWESKKSEKEVKESEERYRRLFESAHDGMLIIDAESGEIEDANPYIQELLGYSKEELIGKKLWQIGSFKNVAENKKRFDELTNEGYIRYEDLPLKTKEGEETPVEFVSNTYQVGGKKVVQCNIRDLSDRKIAEKRFEKSERRFKKIYNASPDPTFLLDKEGIFQDVNDAAVKKLGYEKDEILRKSLLEAPFLSEKYQEKTMERFKKRKSGEKIPPYDVELTTKEGDIVHAEINVAVFEEEGFEGEIVIGRDVTKRKKAENELKKTKKRLQMALDTTDTGIWEYNIEDELNVWYESMEKLVGLEPGSTSEHTFDSLLERVHPEDISEAKTYLNEAIESGTLNNVDLRIKHENGQWIWVEIRAEKIEDSEGKERLMGTATDITERKEREVELEKTKEKFQSYVRNAPIGVLVTDLEGEYIEVNDSACEMTGYSEEELIGMNIFDLTPPEHHEKAEESFEELLETGETRIEIPFLKKDGSHGHWIVNVVKLEDQTIAFTEDITKRKEMEEKLIQAKEDYEKLIEGMNDAVFIHDMDGNFLKVNQEAVDRLGYTREELLEKGPGDIDTAEHSKDIKEKIKDIEDKKELIFETVHVTKEGRKIPEEINSSYISYQGEPAVLSVARNIKDRKEREKELNLLYSILRLSQKPEIELENIFGKTAQMIPEAFQYPEVTSAKIVFDDDEYKSEDYEESGRNLKKKLSIDDSVRGSIQVNYLEERPKEDVGIFLEEEVKLLEAVVEILTSIVKREERKQQLIDSEERYRSIIENSVVGVTITDLEDELIFANDRFAEMLGYDKEEIMGKNVSEITSEDVYEKISGKTKSRKEGLSEVYETELKKKNGESVSVIMGATPYRDGKGEVSGTVGYVQDITERKEAKEREEFLHSLLRHDIRNKIQVIEGYLHLMKEEIDFSGDAEEYLLKAEKGVRSSVELIEKIRTLREANNEEIGEISMESTFHDAVGALQDQMMDIEMEITMDCEKDCRVKAGPLLQEVFSNIIENSIKYSEGTKIHIKIEETDDEGICIIEDDGKGISDEKKDKIFQRGFTTDADRGTGLGLFLVDKLINIYDGKIDVKDSELGGARFEVRLKKV